MRKINKILSWDDNVSNPLKFIISLNNFINSRLILHVKNALVYSKIWDFSGQEISTKGSSSSTCTDGSRKLKRVRTIFTAEQLERLEGEFARQQYMVGPERLYLAHALRLTEAQVKVWFQNRRIKWRKLNHEQQSQRLHEFHQTSLSNLEQEDSNDLSEWQK